MSWSACQRQPADHHVCYARRSPPFKNLVASLVEDLIYAPASQAYVEQFFHSVYGVKDREAGEF